MLVDRDALVRGPLAGQAEPASGPIPVQSWAFASPPGGAISDPLGAAVLLDAAGWLTGRTASASVRHSAPTGAGERRHPGAGRVARALADELRAGGVDARLRASRSTSYSTTFWSRVSSRWPWPASGRWAATRTFTRAGTPARSAGPAATTPASTIQTSIAGSNPVARSLTRGAPQRLSAFPGPLGRGAARYRALSPGRQLRGCPRCPRRQCRSRCRTRRGGCARQSTGTESPSRQDGKRPAPLCWRGPGDREQHFKIYQLASGSSARASSAISVAISPVAGPITGCSRRLSRQAIA